ncbi:MAG: spore coat associated protein CotJA [Clostridia bacterium]|nr:spore coat associated protein CotJA [Clostridia bacterium]
MMKKQCRYTPSVRTAEVGRQTAVPENASCALPAQRSPLAMVYPEEQKFIDLYTPEEALTRGTLFKQLDMPFHKGFRI